MLKHFLPLYSWMIETRIKTIKDGYISFILLPGPKEGAFWVTFRTDEFSRRARRKILKIAVVLL